VRPFKGVLLWTMESGGSYSMVWRKILL
jgi:hypothetical protein